MEILVILFFLGIAVGSFLNVVILRFEAEEKITGRSRCMNCKKQLVWYELVPVFSYLFQKGKCRNCEIKLSAQYPLVEFFAGILFLCVGYVFQTNNVSLFFLLTILFHLVIWSLFVVVTVYDFKTKLIPDEFSYTLSFFAFLSMFISVNGFVLPTVWHFLAGPLLFLPFYLLWKISDGKWLGLGDGKLALGIGWFLGFSLGATAVLVSFWVGAAISLLIIGIQKIVNYLSDEKHKSLTLKSEIPFGPFLVIGTFIVYMFQINLFSGIIL